VWHVGGLFSWRPVEGVDVIGEILYRESDWTLTSASPGDDKNDLIGGLQITANLN
jgi:hypothetical protein